MEIQRPNKPRAVNVKFAANTSVPPTNNKNQMPPKPVKGKAQSGKATVNANKKPIQKIRPAQKKAEAKAELNRKIRTQTPASREQARRVKKVGGSVKNLEIKRRSNSSKQKFYVKKKRTNLGKLLLARLILFLIMFAIMFSLVAWIFSARLTSGSITTGRAYTLQIGEDKAEDDTSNYSPEYLEIPEECAERNNTVYIPVSALIDLCSLTVTGTNESLRYIPRNSGNQTMSFEVGSNLVKINGTTLRMTAPSFSYEGKLYVPLDFFTSYANGLVITENSENAKITISLANIGYDALTDSKIYDTLGFKAFKTEALPNIAEPTDY